jgi:hypothetical protein
VEGSSWRLAILMLCVCVSLVLLACSSITSTPFITPTEMAPITLTVWLASATPLLTPWLPITATPAARTPQAEQTITYIVNPGDTLEDVARNFGIETALLQAANPRLTAQEGLTAYDYLIIPYIPPTQTPQPLEVDAPDCYMTLADEYICLGLIRNSGSVTVKHVSIHFALVALDGSLISETTAGVEQAHILPGQMAPYRVLFRVIATPAATPSPARVNQTSMADATPVASQSAPDDAARLGVVINQSRVIFDLRSADAVSPEATTMPLTVAHQRVENAKETSASKIAVQLSNPTDTIIPRLRIITSLFDADQNLVGYRVIDSEALRPGESRSLEVEVQPMIDVSDMTYTVYAEAIAN